jgi:hypothetical protein
MKIASCIAPNLTHGNIFFLGVRSGGPWRIAAERVTSRL